MFRLLILTGALTISGGKNYLFEDESACIAAGQKLIRWYQREGMDISFECKKEEVTQS